MPRERQSITHKFSIAGHEGYITAGAYEDGTVGEIFLTDVGKEGSTLRGMMNAFATSVSIALQYGVPLETLVRKFSYMRFDPEGITGNPEIPFAKSMPDYIMRWLGVALPRRGPAGGARDPHARGAGAEGVAGGAACAGTRPGPANGGNGHSGNGGNGGAPSPGRRRETTIQPGTTRPAAEAMTDEPPACRRSCRASIWGRRAASAAG